MKLIHSKFVKDGAGFVKVVPEHVEDLWHAYNLIREGDILTAVTFRKVIKDRGNNADAERVKLMLSLTVDSVDFDPEGEEIRVAGKNNTESEHIRLGAHHTVTLDLQHAFNLEKEKWDILDVDRLKLACDPSQSADLAVLLMTDGLANLLLVGGSCTVIRAKIEQHLPRKYGAAIAAYEKAIQRFYEACLQAVIKHVDFSIVKCLVIAGPGFAKDEFKKYMDAESVRQNIRPLIENKESVVLAPASSAYKHALKDVLEAPGISERIKDTLASREVKALASFYAMLAEDSARAFYGPGHVAAAADIGAVQTLLITDSIFRVNNVHKRRKVAELVESIREGAGEVLVFSTMHVSGQQLAKLSGIAAILRFPCEELEEQEIEPPF